MQAPTDNLYKFLAISGLICFLFFYFDYAQRHDALQIRKDDWMLKAAEMKAVMAASSEVLATMEKRQKALSSKNRTEAQIDADFAEGARFQEKFLEKTLAVDTSEQTRELIVRTENELSLLKNKYDLYKAFSIILFTIGLVLWYWKTQRHIDRKERLV